MAIENISQDVADLLATKDYDVKYTDGQGQDSSPEEAKTFAFDWVAGSGKNYGTVVIVLGDENDLQLFFGDNLGKTMENPQDKLDWFGSERETGFLPELKNFATQHRYTFSPKDINQLKHTMQGMAAIKEGLFEGYYGTRKISYVGEQTEARLVIKHNRMIGEDDKRYRYVESLFIETAEGERFKLPFVKLSGGRAMLEHVKQGGRPYDIRGQHINEIVSEMAVLSRFNRASQQRVFEGVTQELVETAQHYYSELRGNLQHMATGRGYNQYFESWTPADIGDETALVEDLKTMFIEQTLDARIEAALPTLAKIQQRGTAMKEAQIFENWINNIMEGTWALPDTPEAQAKLNELMSQELIVGPDATNATQQLYDVIGDDRLFDILGDLAEQDPRANIWDDTDVQARLQELGIQMNTTPDAEQQQPVAPAAGQQAPGTAPGQGMAEDQLDELSPSTLSNYVNQAVDDVADRSNSTGFRKGARVASQAFAGGSKDPGRFEKDPKIANRKVGISRAIGRMAENTELNDMLKYAGVPISESRIHENSEYTHEIIAKTLAREKPGMATLKTSKDFYNAVYHELIAIGMTPRSARNLIAYDEDFMGDVATSYNHYQSNPGLDEDNVSIMPEGAAVDAYMAGKSPAIAHFADQLDKNTEIKEGSCNATMEGEYCPEHGLTECGMYEMGTVAGSVAPVVGEGTERDKFYYQRNDIWRVMDGDEVVDEYKPARYEVVGAKKLLAQYDDDNIDVTHVISPMGVVTYLYSKPEDEIGEQQEAYYESKADNALLARIKSLALLK